MRFSSFGKLASSFNTRILSSHDLANIITSALFCDVILQILQDIISSIYTSVWFIVRRRTEGLCEAISHYLITLLLECIDLSGCG